MMNSTGAYIVSKLTHIFDTKHKEAVRLRLLE